MKRRSGKNDSMEMVIKKVSEVMRRVSLGGLIEDMVAEINGKDMFIEAIDLSNSVIVVTRGKVFKNKMRPSTIGMIGIETLMKFFSTINESSVKFTIEDNAMVFKRKDSKRKMKMLIAADPEMIPTRLEKENDDDDVIEIFTNMQDFKIPLSKEAVSDILTYINLSQSKETAIVCSEDKAKIVIGNENENQFEIILDNVEVINEIDDDITAKVNGEHLSKILNVVKTGEDDNTHLYVSDEKPVLIIENKTMWAMMQISDGE